MKLKKILAAFLAFLLVLSLCSCGKMTPEKLMAGMAKALTKVESVSGTLNTELDMDMLIIGTELNMEAALSTNVAYSDSVTHTNGTYTVNLNGREAMDTPVESYTVIDGESVTNYYRTDGKWYKSSAESASAETASFDFSTIKELLSSENLGTVTLREELETLNGEEVYVMDIDNCRYTQLALDFILPQIENSLGSIDFSTFDFSGIEMDLTIKVYKDSKLPAELTIDYGDSLTSVMKDATDIIIKGIGDQFDMGFDIISMIFGNLEIDIAVPNVKAVINFKEYNNSSVTVPDEALNAKEMDDRENYTIFDSLF